MHVKTQLLIEDLPRECIADCSGPGRKDEAVSYWRQRLELTVDREQAVRCLRGYGAWGPEELANCTDAELAEKILWLACGDFAEWDGTGTSPGGSDIFCLE